MIEIEASRRLETRHPTYQPTHGHKKLVQVTHSKTSTAKASTTHPPPPQGNRNQRRHGAAWGRKIMTVLADKGIHVEGSGEQSQEQGCQEKLYPWLVLSVQWRAVMMMMTMMMNLDYRAYMQTHFQFLGTRTHMFIPYV